MYRYTRTIFTTALIAVAALAGTAQATGSAYVVAQNASGPCKPALPLYDTNIRARPLAFQNESTTNQSAFANCMFSWQKNSYGVESYRVLIRNLRTTGAAVTVNCTGVAGQENTASYRVKSVSVAPGASAWVSFNGADFNLPAEFKRNPNVQCLLPNLVGITETEVQFRHSN